MDRSRATCRKGIHQKTPENTGRRGECIPCHQDYQREYMRAKRRREAFPDEAPEARVTEPAQ